MINNNQDQYKSDFYHYMFNNINLYREVLQKIILVYMYDYFYTDTINKHKQNNLVFMWWTNLRLCYSLPRWSEDLDFVYIWKINEFPFKSMINYVVDRLKTNHSLDVEVKKTNKNTNVWKNFYVFSFGTITNKTLRIKLEIDINPPKWWVIIKNIISNTFSYPKFIKPFSYNIITYNLDTTFMWKFWAILWRNYVKWRDIFDIWWYLNNLYLIQNLNFTYLNSVIEQINKSSNRSNKLDKIELNEHGKIQFINLFTNKCMTILREKKEEIINDVSSFILDEWIKNVFLNDLQTGSFLTKSNQLVGLPII